MTQTYPENSRPSRSNLIRLDISLIATLLLCLFATIPLMMNPNGLPNGSDVLYHTYRVAEMDRSWVHGVFLPRWAEGLYYGYGSPLWHFYAGLTYYLTSILIRLFSMGALDALRMMIVLSTVGAGAGMYLFMKSWTGRLAGVLAALVYVYSPYLVYTEPYARGTYPELLAFALFPFILWRFVRLLQERSGFNLFSASVSLFLLIITHNLMAITLTGLLGGWILFEAFMTWLPGIFWRRNRAERSYGASVFALFALLLGVGLSAYFWLPVLVESDTVSLSNLTGVPLLNYRNFFVPLNHLLAMRPLQDAGAINGLDNVLTVGLAQWVLALIGVLGTCVVSIVAPSQRPGWMQLSFWVRLIYFAGMAAVMIFLVTPFAAGVWEGVSQLAYLQFPWRLLGPIALCLAVLAGFNALWIERLPRRSGAFVIMAIIASVIGLAMRSFYVPEWTNTTVDTTIAGYHASEVAGLQRGTTFTDEYRPRDVPTVANATPRLLDDYADGYPVNHANLESLPEDVALMLTANGPQYSVWQVDTPEPFTLEILIHYWEGWAAKVDGEVVDITPAPNHGFITFPVPAGQHTLQVYLASTPPRTLGIVISLAAQVILILGSLGLRRSQEARLHIGSRRLSAPYIGGIIGGGGVALLLIAAFFHVDTAWLDSAPGTSPAENPVTINLGDDFRVVGYDINGRTFHPGDRLEVTVYWYPVHESDIDFSSFLHVYTWGPPVVQVDKLHPGGRAISEWWRPDGYIKDTYVLTLPTDLAPGEYNLRTGLYTFDYIPAEGDWPNGYRPPVTDADGNIVSDGESVPLGTITVE